MRDTKTELRFFAIPEWKKEEKYLRKQHKNGWEFVCVNFLCFYHFRKCPPKDVVYQLDFNTESITQKDEYIQMFRDCGWEYIQNNAGYSYFRKAASEMDGNGEEIFCDDISKLDMMQRVFKKRMIPLLCIFFFIIIPQIFMRSQFDMPGDYGLLIIFCVLFVVYLILFIKFAIQFWKYFKSIHR